MTRFGWIILAVFALGAVAFLFLIDPNHVGRRASPAQPTDATPPGNVAMPVVGIAPSMLTDTFNQPRGGGTRAHGALDIMAARGTLVVAAAPGRVERIFESAAGGHTVYVRSSDERYVYYYAHLDRYAAGLREGADVTRGDPIGFVGSTGNASAEAPHLHFEIKAMAPGERWYQGRALDPYPVLAGPAPPR